MTDQSSDSPRDARRGREDVGCLPPPANKNFRKMTGGGMEGETERERRKGQGTEGRTLVQPQERELRKQKNFPISEEGRKVSGQKLCRTDLAS